MKRLRVLYRDNDVSAYEGDEVRYGVSAEGEVRISWTRTGEGAAHGSVAIPAGVWKAVEYEAPGAPPPPPPAAA